MVSCSAVTRITVRMQVSLMRIRITPPRIRMRTSALTYAFKNGSDNMKPYKRMTALPLGKKFQANLLKVLVGTPARRATEGSD